MCLFTALTSKGKTILFPTLLALFFSLCCYKACEFSSVNVILKLILDKCVQGELFLSTAVERTETSVTVVVILWVKFIIVFR